MEIRRKVYNYTTLENAVSAIDVSYLMSFTAEYQKWYQPSGARTVEAQFCICANASSLE